MRSRANIPLIAQQVIETDKKKAAVLREDHALQGLTPQQEKFCQHVWMGHSWSDAYRQAYNCEGSADVTIQARASELARHSLVVARLQQLRDRFESETSRAFTLPTRLDLAETLDEIRRDKLAKNSDRIKAVDMLGKMPEIGLHRTLDDKDIDELSIDELNARLEARLAGLKDITPQ